VRGKEKRQTPFVRPALADPHPAFCADARTVKNVRRVTLDDRLSGNNGVST